MTIFYVALSSRFRLLYKFRNAGLLALRSFKVHLPYGNKLF